MGRQQTFYKPTGEGTRKNFDVHPIWRGIGFLMVIIIPAMAYITTLVLLDQNAKHGWMAIPPEAISPYLNPLLYVYIGMTVAISFILYTVTLLITFSVYRAFGPSRYGPLDAPPIKARVTKRSR
jgi:hypothetical protein